MLQKVRFGHLWDWLAAAAFVAVTIFMTWPLTPRMHRTVQDPGDPLFEIWVMRTVQHRLLHAPGSLYDGNIFFPFSNTLAYSEEMLSTAVLGWPVYLLTGNDVLAYNFMLLTSFWLVAFAVYLLAKELGAAPGAAFVAGVVAAFAPARYAQLSHLHMLTIGWLPLALWALTRYVRRGEQRYLALTVAVLSIQFLASLHLAVFSTLALALYFLFLVRFEGGPQLRTPRGLAKTALALTIPFVLLAPTLLPHLWVGDEYRFSRSRAEIEAFSAVPRDYLATYTFNGFWTRVLDDVREPFFPGLVVIVGVVLALLVWRRWWVWFAATLTVIAVVLSFGFAVNVGRFSVPMPYAVLFDLVPPIRGIRGVARFGLLTAIGLPLLAAFGYSAVWQRLRERIKRKQWQIGLVLTAGLALFACVELRAPAGTSPSPTSQELAVYTWLAEQPAGPVAEFPANGLLVPPVMPPGGVFQPIYYMYGATRHWNPILNGYSGFAPAPHFRILAQFDDQADPARMSMVTPWNVGILQELGIRWLLFHPLPDYNLELALATADALPQLRRVASVGGTVVYAVLPTQRTPLPAEATQGTLPQRVAPGTALSITFTFQNPHENLSILHLDVFPVLEVRWTNAAGRVVLVQTLEAPLPNTVPPGESALVVDVAVPEQPGAYQIHLSLDRTTIPNLSRPVRVE